jgi:antirestriction protein
MTMRVWIGCLNCYNNSRPTGKWYDAIGAGEVTTEQLHEETDSRIPGELAKITHEELWVMDHEGFGDLLTGECSPMTADEIASLVDDLDDDRRAAFGHYIQHTGSDIDDSAMREFDDAYRGFWDSEKDFAYSEADDAESELRAALAAHQAGPYGKPGKTDDVHIPWPYSCIDWDAATRELFMDGYWSADTTSGVHVFISY